MKNILAIITARGGSKGLPRKNILSLHGKPLIAWSIEAVKGAACQPFCLVSTDDVEIAAVCETYDAKPPFLRPLELATDTASSIDVVLHALHWYEQIHGDVDILMLLQPTSPLRNAGDIDAALSAMLSQNAPACVSVCACEHPPQWSYSLAKNGCLHMLFAEPSASRRQDIATAYRLNGALYVAQGAWFKERKSFMSPETLAYVMPQERSVDIDSHIDLAYAEFLLSYNNERVRA